MLEEAPYSKACWTTRRSILCGSRVQHEVFEWESRRSRSKNHKYNHILIPIFRIRKILQFENAFTGSKKEVMNREN